jgi:hypothetical protein
LGTFCLQWPRYISYLTKVSKEYPGCSFLRIFCVFNENLCSVHKTPL